jgi:lipid-A-disaccharide synthase
MVVAGEASGDLLATELVQALRKELRDAPSVSTTDAQPLYTSLEPRFFGAGGPRMAAAGIQLAFDMTAHAVIGLSDVLRQFFKFRRLFQLLFRLAREREPDAIICVDFSGFNRRLAHAIKRYSRSRADWFHNWEPKLIQYVSPQVWASREGRAVQIARDYDLLLSLFPFEKKWYYERVPQLNVEFIGHPMVDRYGPVTPRQAQAKTADTSARLLLLPGSRTSELSRHLPVMFAALSILRTQMPALRVRMVLPDANLLRQTTRDGLPEGVEAQSGGLPGALAEADVAIASTGTVTLECAYFGVPTVALYKTSELNYQIAKRIVTVRFLAMPNLLANEEIFPEFIQNSATGENLAHATLELLRNPARCADITRRLAQVIASLGGPGASRRAARAILRLMSKFPQ